MGNVGVLAQLLSGMGHSVVGHELSVDESTIHTK